MGNRSTKRKTKVRFWRNTRKRATGRACPQLKRDADAPFSSHDERVREGRGLLITGMSAMVWRVFGRNTGDLPIMKRSRMSPKPPPLISTNCGASGVAPELRGFQQSLCHADAELNDDDGAGRDAGPRCSDF